MGHTDFASRMNTFLSKDSTSASTSTLKAQKLPESIPLKRIRIPIIKPFDNTFNKKQKSNPMAPSRKVKYIRRKKIYNGY